MLGVDPWRRVCGRWNDGMESPTLKREHWRKSGQWFALNRRHAQIVVDDTEVAQAFKECARSSCSCSCSALQRCSVINGIHAALTRLPLLLASSLTSGNLAGSPISMCLGLEIMSTTVLQALLGGLRSHCQWLGSKILLPC